MSNTFYAKLINKEDFDPGLYLRFAHQKRAILFDLPDLKNLTPKEILKIEDVFVTHTHMDHFVGFDLVLRLSLGRKKTLNIYGPQGIIGNVEGKLRGYTWNLIGNYEGELKINVNEIEEDFTKVATFSSKNAFQKKEEYKFERYGNIITRQSNYKVYATVLDHLVPSIGYMLEEEIKVNIIKEKLNELGLRPGPWLSKFKEDVYNRIETKDIVIDAKYSIDGQKKYFSLSDLKTKIVKITEGRRISYISDIVGSAENIEKIVKAFGYCDVLFIEASFLTSDEELAKKTYHLTTYEAGYIAALLKVKYLTVFHHSLRYKGQEQVLLNEVFEAYRANLKGSQNLCLEGVK